MTITGSSFEEYIQKPSVSQSGNTLPSSLFGESRTKKELSVGKLRENRWFGRKTGVCNMGTWALTKSNVFCM